MLFLLSCVETGVDRIKGEGIYQPQIAVEPSSLSFGTLPMSESLALPLEIRNVGDVNLQLGSVMPSGIHAAAFTMLGDPSGDLIAPGEGVSLSVVYTAVQDGEGTELSIASDDSEQPTLLVPMDAGISTGMLEIQPNPVDFGNVAAGVTARRSATLRNIGNAPLALNSLVVSGEPFSLSTSPTLPMTLAPQESTSVDMAFSPTEDGAWWSYLWATTDEFSGFHAIPLVGTAGDAVIEDTGDPTTDTCFDKAAGYSTHAGARFFVTDLTPITVTYLGTDAGYSSTLYLESPTSKKIATGHSDAAGLVMTLGPYNASTELVFGIHVHDTKDQWLSGPASRNSDGEIHAAITYNGDCSWTIGFEDLNGGGDRDYNDILMRVQGQLQQAL